MKRIFAKTLIFSTLVLCVFSKHGLAQGNVNFSASVTAGCSPLQVNFNDLTGNSPTHWKWDFGNGGTAFIKNPSIVYQDTGTYTVKLVVTNSKGIDSLVKIGFIEVYPNPVANFFFLPKDPCIGLKFQFSDSSKLGKGQISQWHWGFGDGSSLDTNKGLVRHAYGFANSFPVSLWVTDTKGCTSTTITKQVPIHPDPKAQFTVSASSNCAAPFTTQFNNTSKYVSPTNFTWYFGDGDTSHQVSPKHTFASQNFYNIALVVRQGGCSDSLMAPNFVKVGGAQVSFTSKTTESCVNQQVSFSNNALAQTLKSKWYFGDGDTSNLPSPIHTYLNPGSYNVSLKIVDKSGCVDSAGVKDYLTIDTLPEPHFSTSFTQLCALPLTVQFKDSSIRGNTFKWDFGDGNTSPMQNPSHNFATAGPFRIVLTVKSKQGCSDTISHTIARQNFVKADFTAPKRIGCAPLNVNFKSISAFSPLDSIVNYKWYMGIDTLSSGRVDSIPNKYDSTGTYDIKLLVTTSRGCQDSITKPQYVMEGLHAGFNFTPLDTQICFGRKVDFLPILMKNNITSWVWDFGEEAKGAPPAHDSLGPKIIDVFHNYADTGTFTVKLFAYNNGCEDSIIHFNSIKIDPPIPSFSYTMVCAPAGDYVVNFDATASVKADSIVWDFGDGKKDTTGTAFKTSHVYPGRGGRVVTLWAFNKQYHCSFYKSITIDVTRPVASFSAGPLVGCYPLLVEGRDTSIDAVSFKWTFGDGNAAQIRHGVNTYQKPGLYAMKLLVTDVNGCKDSLIRPNYVNVLGPLPYFKADTIVGCAPLANRLQDHSISDSTLVRWKWFFGDGDSALTTQAMVNHIYQKVGTYSPAMYVTDTNGCTIFYKSLKPIVTTFPIPKFTTDSLACKGVPSIFDATSTSAFKPQYAWRFGDGTKKQVTNNAQITHSFSSRNFFQINLSVTDGNGCADSVKKTVFVDQPKADFSDSTLTIGCGQSNVQFKDLSTGYATKWHWDFGYPGASSNAQNPVNLFTSPGFYNVRLIAINPAGCSDTITRDSAVFVYGGTGTYNFTPTQGCSPFTTKFTVTATNTSNFIWDFKDGFVTTIGVNNLVHTYDNAGSYGPLLLLETKLPDGSSCKLKATPPAYGPVKVLNTATVKITPSTYNLVEGDKIDVTPNLNIASGYQVNWFPTNGVDCPTCLDVFVTSQGMNKVYYLTVVDTVHGCRLQDSIQIVNVPCKHNIILPNIFTPNDDGVNDLFNVINLCPGDEVNMEIFNRWGESIQQYILTKEGWDGHTKSGNLAPEGEYFYVVEVNKKTYKGVVQLVRGK